MLDMYVDRRLCLRESPRSHVNYIHEFLWASWILIMLVVQVKLVTAQKAKSAGENEESSASNEPDSSERSQGWEFSIFGRLESSYFISLETYQRYTRAIENSEILPYFHNTFGDVMSHRFIHDRSSAVIHASLDLLYYAQGLLPPLLAFLSRTR